MSCANVVPLTGGAKDETPPLLEKAKPDTFATNVPLNVDKIKLYFDEFVVVTGAFREVFVSPPLETPVQVKGTGKGLEVDFADTVKLRPNTTYKINFGKSIKDNNEGNILQNFEYVFSTGAQLDSGKIYLRALDAFTLKPVQGAAAQLYQKNLIRPALDTMPQYVGYAGSNGIANLNYLTSGKYQAIILVENQKDFKLNNYGELIGFADSLLTTTSGKDTAILNTIYVYLPYPDTNFITSANIIAPGLASVKLAGPVKNNDTIFLLPDTLQFNSIIQKTLTERRDSLLIWFAPDSITELNVIFKTKNSIDTNSVIISKTYNAADTSNFLISTTLDNTNPNLPIRIHFKKPVISIKQDTVSALNVNDSTAINFTFSNDSAKCFTAKLNGQFKEGGSYVITLGDSFFLTHNKRWSDSIQLKINVGKTRHFQQLTFNILESPVPNAGILAYLYSAEEKLIAKKTIGTSCGKQCALTFKHVPLGNYILKIAIDKNKNGFWDAGSYKNGILPETVYYFPEKISVKKGFAIKLDWKIGQQKAAPGSSNKNGK